MRKFKVTVPSNSICFVLFVHMMKYVKNISGIQNISTFASFLSLQFVLLQIEMWHPPWRMSWCNPWNEFLWITIGVMSKLNLKVVVEILLLWTSRTSQKIGCVFFYLIRTMYISFFSVIFKICHKFSLIMITCCRFSRWEKRQDMETKRLGYA